MRINQLILKFDELADTGKTKVWGICGLNETNLGVIEWYAPWRRYCFFPHEDMLFDISCLTQVVSFMDVEMNKRNEPHP